MADIDRDGERGAERRVVVRHHRVEMQPPRLVQRSGAQTMPEVWRMMKAIFSGVHSDRRDEQIALVLAVVVVGDDDDLAARERGDGGFECARERRPLHSSLTRCAPQRWRRERP